ncbi:MAG: IMP dehydrogenase [Rhizobiales bacterium TMED168]|nr:MAG: IMP dehydrogenase [Rhizobiales bacterium TMED168]|tara:strand:+ start:31127 stop:32590 length:1464 start_codon:yes stop_codon:yes gene_type:complete
MKIREGITFDDVLLEPGESSVLPSEANIKTKITKKISLSIPLISAAMDTVTESKMAIALAQAGGLGVIHRNLSVDQQIAEVKKVKKFESGMVINPVTISPDQTLKEALNLMEIHNISGIPVTDLKTKKLQGIITNRDVRFASNKDQKVSELMTKDNLITVSEGVSQSRAKEELHKHRIEKLIVVDKKYRCIGLITVKDIEKSQLHPTACKDDQGRLRVAAATSVGDQGFDRARGLIDAGVDLIIVDTAHGHSSQVSKIVRRIKKLSKSVQLIAGNVATKEATKSLIDAGADCIKVGIGPGSICTTRIVAGVGVPQLSAIIDCASEAHKTGIPVIADGGIKFSGDFAKALAAGADVAMIGSLFAGTVEAPGEIFLHQGRRFKSYRGMGSVAAMAEGSADRYFQSDLGSNEKLVPEGVEGQVPYTGSVQDIIYQMVGGLRASMGYTGNKTIKNFQTKTKFIRISPASLTESHTHDVLVTREAPNYPVRG